MKGDAWGDRSERKQEKRYTTAQMRKTFAKGWLNIAGELPKQRGRACVSRTGRTGVTAHKHTHTHTLIRILFHAHTNTLTHLNTEGLLFFAQPNPEQSREMNCSSERATRLMKVCAFSVLEEQGVKEQAEGVCVWVCFGVEREETGDEKCREESNIESKGTDSG